jgi:6-phosphofructokinase 1
MSPRRAPADSSPRNVLIAQSGGPTAVINQSLVGVALAARASKRFGRVLGALHGMKGILDGAAIDLDRESPAHLERVAATPAAALGSSRFRPSPEDCEAILDRLDEWGVGFLFYIGGNDSAQAAHLLNEAARRRRRPLAAYHVPKTIDNDLLLTDHCPGYGSAARFVASAFMGLDLDNRALPGINITIVMGRDAGFLTAASALARVAPDSGPHLIYVPERPLSAEQFVADVRRTLDRCGRCLIAVSEGLRDEEGKRLSERLITGIDAFGNKQLSGSGALGDFLMAALRRGVEGKLRLRSDTLGYLQRSFVGVVSETDAREARAVGRFAVRMAARGEPGGSVAIVRKPGARYAVEFKLVSLERVAAGARAMPESFISRAGNDVTQAFLNYARPLVGPLPPVARLSNYRID